MASFLNLELKLQIISYLDPQSLSAVSVVDSGFAFLTGQYFKVMPTLGPAFPPAATQGAAPVSGLTIPVTAAALANPSDDLDSSDNDTLASSNTEMSQSPEEKDWVFEQTPELMRRLSLLPSHTVSTSLPALPTELQLQIFGYLDKIDACCFGLSSPRTYGIFRAIHGTKMPLNTRRTGPNLFERVWEVVGAKPCVHCGIYRCELHNHIKSWMPKELEYCNMKQNFGVPAPNGAKATCFRGKPSKPHRCGRHPLRTTSMHQDDTTMSTL
ncbi:hypothetical protein LSUE1_G005535 [Lachnellula suecica]|uniref:F-box domain-containing protein n=1 Tax=Lachnellula suecica TaxID=602035 RepID=A0A8T9BXG0_9HELO|nr:hypothetical protein LSUE1_G005535 [Lachnellula suecica]